MEIISNELKKNAAFHTSNLLVLLSLGFHYHSLPVNPGIQKDAKERSSVSFELAKSRLRFEGTFGASFGFLGIGTSLCTVLGCNWPSYAAFTQTLNSNMLPLFPARGHQYPAPR